MQSGNRKIALGIAGAAIIGAAFYLSTEGSKVSSGLQPEVKVTEALQSQNLEKSLELEDSSNPPVVSAEQAFQDGEDNVLPASVALPESYHPTQLSGVHRKTKNEIHKLKQMPLSAEEIRSVQALSQFMAVANTQSLTTKELVKKYNQIGLQAKVLSNENPYTGKMDVIKSESRIPGVRYLITQVLENSEGKSYIQRASFEVRPGPDSFVKTVEAVAKTLPKNARVALDTPERKTWAAPGGAYQTVKILREEDLVNSPYKTYSKNDVGTVLVMIEEDVEDAFKEPEGGE